MQRVKRSTAVAVLPVAPGGGTPGFFALPNPGGGIPATVPGYEWYNGVQEEMMAVIEGASLVPDVTKNNQLATAIQSGKLYSSAAGGSADALTGAFTPAIGAFINGMILYVRAASANATTTPAFTPNTGLLLSKTIVKGNGIALVAGDIAGAGHWIELQYDATLDKWLLLNPATGIATVTATNNASYVDNSVKPASTSWVRGAMPAIATAAGFVFSGGDVTTSGYIKFPSWLGGLIVQWGRASVAANGSTITLPIAYTTKHLRAFTQYGDCGVAGSAEPMTGPGVVGQRTLTNFVGKYQLSTGVNTYTSLLDWWSLGY